MRKVLVLAFAVWVLTQDTADNDELLNDLSERTERLADFQLNTAPVLSFDDQAVAQESANRGGLDLVASVPSAAFGSVSEAVGTRATQPVEIPIHVVGAGFRMRSGWSLRLKNLEQPARSADYTAFVIDGTRTVRFSNGGDHLTYGDLASVDARNTYRQSTSAMCPAGKEHDLGLVRFEECQALCSMNTWFIPTASDTTTTTTGTPAGLVYCSLFRVVPQPSGRFRCFVCNDNPTPASGSSVVNLRTTGPSYVLPLFPIVATVSPWADVAKYFRAAETTGEALWTRVNGGLIDLRANMSCEDVLVSRRSHEHETIALSRMSSDRCEGPATTQYLHVPKSWTQGSLNSLYRQGVGA